MSPDVTVTLRARRLPYWLALLAVLMIILPDQGWTGLAVGLGGLLLVARGWAHRLARGLRGRRELHGRWVAVGDPLEEWFELENSAVLPALWVEVTDQSTVPGYDPAVVRSVNGRSRDRWRRQALCRRRGRFTLGPWALHTGDPFGLFRVTVTYADESEIIIHPPIHVQLPIALPAGRSSGGVQRRLPHQQALVNAAGVRDYRPNDPFQRIHWPTTARRDTLSVRLFDQDAAGDVWIVLDVQASVQLGEGATSTLEQAVLLAASLATQGLQENRAIGLAAYGHAPLLLPPGRGQGHQWRLLRALALVEADAETPLARALADLRRVVRRGSAVLVITPTDSAEWLPAFSQLTHGGTWAEVALLNRSSFGGRANHHLLPAVRRAGGAAALVDAGDVGLRVTRPRDEERWEVRITPLGKAVLVRRPPER